MSDTNPVPGLSRAVRLSAVRAFLAGRAAKREGLPVTECPFDLDSDAENPEDAVTVAAAAIERFSADAWIKGWSRS